ncbi:hypothetical protein C0Q70_06008 [Pomacea canaliculata]|uniref:Receptor ligand binding region domain-containing protein n=1 Tax=Pomacea canaliculata TaxID=400727 RepID=A0A2T7PMT2_POMCA|nr:hypothetical protein C0Q70_06008 [Pomacea canaliculata]
MEGDLYVIGMLSIHDQNTHSPLQCAAIKTLAGADLAEALDILPGRKIGFLLINTCSSPLLARQRLLDLHTGRLVLPDGSMRNSSVILPYIMGYVGAYASGDSMAAADTLTNIGTPFVQVSPASTSPLLKDRSTYPYFMRLVPSDDIQARVLLNVAVRLNASYIQIMYDKTAVYAQTLVQTIQETVKNNYAKVCIAQKIAITPVNEVSEYKWIKDELRKKSSARLVIVVLYPTEITKIMDAILPELTANDNFFFLASNSWGRRQALIEDKTKLEGSLVFSQEIPQDQFFGSYFKSLDPTQTENIWLRYFWEARKNCFFNKSFERKGKTGMCPDNVAADYVDDPRASLHIQAMYALVIGVNQTLSRLCGPAARSMCDAVHSDDLVKTLKTVKLDLYNTGERTQVFDDNGDGLVGFKILQVTRNRTVSDNTMVYKEVGSWKHDTLVLDEKSLTLPRGQTFTDINCPENTSAIVGLSVSLAAVFIILAVIVICLLRRLRQTARRQASTTYSTGHGANNNSSMSADSNSADYSTVDSPYDPNSKETRECYRHATSL